MKFPSKEELGEYTHAIAIGGLKGAAVGGVVSLGIFGYARRYIPNVQRYGAFARTFFLMAPPVLIGITAMEGASRKFEANKYGYITEETKNAQATQGLSTKDKVVYYASANKYKFIMAGWAGSLAGSFWLINRDKLMSKSQKIVQARMYAQGLTVLILLATMALSATSPDEQKKLENKKSSLEWEKIIEKEIAREDAAHLPLHLSERSQAE